MTERDSQADNENGEKEFPSDSGIGLLFKKRREELGLSHDQISEMTRLRPRFLACIEKEEWEGLPSPAFVPGFIRTYARAIGIDEDRAVGLYQETPTVELNPLKPLIMPGRKRKGKYLFVLLLAGIIAFSYYFWKEYDHSSKNVSKLPEKAVDLSSEMKREIGITENEESQVKGELVEEKKPPVVKEISDESVPKPPEDIIGAEAVSGPDEPAQTEKDVIPPEDTAKEKEGQKFLLKADVKERTWVKIRIDGREPKEYVFSPGSQPEWEAKEGFELLIGNAGGLDFMLNGEEMKDLGNPGQVIRLKFPEDFERRGTDN